MDNEQNNQSNLENTNEVSTSEPTVQNSVSDQKLEEKVNEDLPKEEKKKMSTSKKAGIISVILLLLIGGSLGGYYYLNVTNYEKTVLETQFLITAGTSLDAITCNIYSLVWRDAIDSRNKDFNTELANQKSKNQTDGTFSKSEDTKKSIDEAMKKLNNPPSKYQKTYDKLLEMYGTYTKIHSQAMSPSGSLLTFNQNINTLQEDFLKQGNELKVIMPSKDSK